MHHVLLVQARRNIEMNKQRGRRSIGSFNLSSILPHDLILQILLRLPVRSLLRFKSVCKSWRSLISDPQFGKSHFDLAASPTHRYRLRRGTDSEIESLDVDASPLHNYESSLVKPRFPLPFPNSAATNTRDYEPYFLGSCRGFTLVAYDLGDTIIWNPSTGSQRRIPGQENLGEAMWEYLTGFGYDTSTDDYLLVLIEMMYFDREDFMYRDYPNKIEFFSFRTNSWTRFKVTTVLYVNIDEDLRVGSYLNEALHWLVMSYESKLEVIIAFDLVQHGLSEIPLSHNLARKLKHKQYYLRVLGECLSLCYLGSNDSMAEIWMMKKYKVRSSWTKVFAFSTCNIPKNVFFPICFTKHGEIFGSNGTGRLMILNDKGWLLDQCSLWPAPDRLQCIKVDCGMYRESLLSLPNDFEEASEDGQLTNALEEASKDDQ